MQLRDRRIWVTGGCGFIGTHLVRSLAGTGASVKVSDLKAPEVPILGVSYFREDVLEAEVLRKRGAEAEIIFHLAAQPSVVFCESKPVESYRANFLATVGILDQLNRQTTSTGRRCRLVFCSSAAVYGASGSQERSIQEEQGGKSILSHYGMQKWMSEEAIRFFSRNNPLIECVVLRLFNVFGPGFNESSPYASVIPRFATRMVSKRRLTVNGSGNQTRDFIFVRDVVEALMAAAFRANEVDGHAINIGSGAAISIRELAELMQQVAGVKVGLEFGSARPNDIEYSVASIDRAQKVLHWKPQSTLRQGLEELVVGFGFNQGIQRDAA